MDALPAPDSIRRIASEVIHRPDYNLDPLDTTLIQRIIDFVKRMIKPIAAFWFSLYEVSPALAWLTFILLFFVAIALIAHVVYSFKSALGEDKRLTKARDEAEENRLDPRTWEQAAREAAGRQDYISAVRHLFFASLLVLETAQKRNVRRGSTNREYLRRFRNTPAHEALSLFVEVIDVKWYGGGQCGADEYRQAAGAYEKLQRLANAQRA